MLVPLVGMVWAPTSSTTENRELASLPALTDEEGEVNLAYLSETGTWFEDHFAYRSELVTLNALVSAKLFGVSASDQVIVGSDGWLYYEGTLNDYLGTAPLSDRELRCIAHNLFFLQTYTEAQGAQFVFTIAPNKNTLYPEHMPAYYVASVAPSNAERLVPYLEEYGVNYANLFIPLRSTVTGTSQSLYLLRDSHWNNQGAYVADTVLFGELGLIPLPSDVWMDRRDSVGDLDAMLFPSGQTPEQQFYLKGINDGPGFSGSDWSYRGETANVEADLSQTQGKGEDSLIMYRDSFGNALLPYLAYQTEQAEFSKLVPYNALRIADTKPDFVIVERAERHLDYLAYNAPIMPCPMVVLDTTEARAEPSGQAQSSCEIGENGPLVSFSGTIDARLIDDDSRIYVSVQPVQAESSAGVESSQERVFEAFLLGDAQQDGAGGYLVYLPKTTFAQGESSIKVFVTQGNHLFLVQSTRYEN
jgi:hypothetical protein